MNKEEIRLECLTALAKLDFSPAESAVLVKGKDSCILLADPKTKQLFDDSVSFNAKIEESSEELDSLDEKLYSIMSELSFCLYKIRADILFWEYHNSQQRLK